MDIQCVKIVPPVFGNALFFSVLNQADLPLQWEMGKRFDKHLKVNRYKILSANGVQVLSIPLESPKNELPFKDVKIAYHENWMAKHLHAIRSAYGNSPYFEFYYEDIVSIFDRKWMYLLDFNMATIQYIMDKIKIEINVVENREFLRTIEFNEQEFILGELRPYLQVWTDKHPFVGNLSILDYLFCLGKDMKTYLPNFKLLNELE